MQGSTRAQQAVDPMIEYERQLLKILAKFNEVHTQSIGNEEIGKFMMQEIREHEHMVIFMNKLAEANNHMKTQQKKQYILVYGKAAQVFEEALIPYCQKMLNILLKKAKDDGSSDLHQCISDTLGLITFHIVQKAEDYDQQNELLQQVLKVPYTLLTKSTSKTPQAAGAICLSKVIQNMKNELLWDNLDSLMDKIISILKSNTLRAHAALLESLIAIVFYLDEEFVPFVDRFIPVLLEQIQSRDWNTQKVGIEAFNALTTTMADSIIPHRVSILKALKATRVHKMKPVREASQWTIKLLKESQPPLEEHELAILDELPKQAANQRASIREQKSPIRSHDQSNLKSYTLVEKANQMVQGQTPGPRTSSRQGIYGGGAGGASENRKSTSQLQHNSKGNFSAQVLVSDRKDDHLVQNTTNQHESAIDLSQQVQKSGKKVSIATLKRRQKELEQQKQQTSAQRLKSQDKSQNRKPLFSRKPNAAFQKQGDSADPEEILVIVPKHGKPPLQQQATQHQSNADDDDLESMADTVVSGSTSQRKSKAQRKFEREMRQSARQQISEHSDTGMNQDNVEIRVSKRDNQLQNLRKFMNNSRNDDDQDRGEDQDECDIKIYEPKNKRPPAQIAAAEIEENQGKFKRGELDDCQDDLVQDHGHHHTGSKQSSQKPPARIHVKRSNSESSDCEDYSDNQPQSKRRNNRNDEGVEVLWPTKGKHQRSPARNDDVIDGDEVTWPSGKQVSFNNKNNNPNSSNQRKSRHNGDRDALADYIETQDQQQQQLKRPKSKSRTRYHQTEEVDRDGDFLSDTEGQPVVSRHNRFAKYSTYDIGAGEGQVQRHATEVHYQSTHGDDDQKDSSPLFKGSSNKHQARERHDFYTIQQTHERGSSLKSNNRYNNINPTTEDQTAFNFQNNQANIGPQTSQGRSFIERAKWMNSKQNTQYSAATQGLDSMLISSQQKPDHHLRRNNFIGGPQEQSANNAAGQGANLQQTASNFDKYAYQSLSESLQMALSQIDQLNRTVKVMADQLNKVSTEKNQLAQKVGSLEQLVIQVSMVQAGRSNIGAPTGTSTHQQHLVSQQNLHHNTSTSAQMVVAKERSPHQFQQQPAFQNFFDAPSGSKPSFSPITANNNIDPQPQQLQQSMVAQFSLNPQSQQPQMMQPSQVMGQMPPMHQQSVVTDLSIAAGAPNSVVAGATQQSTLSTAMKLIMQNQSLASKTMIASSPQHHQSQNSYSHSQPQQMTEQQVKSLQWPVIENLLQKQMFDEAFMMILRQVSITQIKGSDLNNDSMMLIKALGKVGSFIVNQISEPVKVALYQQLFEILAANEFIDFILSFMQEAVLNYPGTLSASLSQSTAQQLATLREQDLARFMQSSQGSALTMQQRETMDSLVKKYRMCHDQNNQTASQKNDSIGGTSAIILSQQNLSQQSQNQNQQQQQQMAANSARTDSHQQ